DRSSTRPQERLLLRSGEREVHGDLCNQNTYPVQRRILRNREHHTGCPRGFPKRLGSVGPTFGCPRIQHVSGPSRDRLRSSHSRAFHRPLQRSQLPLPCTEASRATPSIKEKSANRVEITFAFPFTRSVFGPKPKAKAEISTGYRCATRVAGSADSGGFVYDGI